MAANDIELRRLVIKAFHMTEVEMGDENKITTSGKITYIPVYDVMFLGTEK